MSTTTRPLMYDREFLLRHQVETRLDPSIQALVNPHINLNQSPRLTSKTGIKSKTPNVKSQGRIHQSTSEHKNSCQSSEGSGMEVAGNGYGGAYHLHSRIHPASVSKLPSTSNDPQRVPSASPSPKKTLLNKEATTSGNPLGYRNNSPVKLSGMHSSPLASPRISSPRISSPFSSKSNPSVVSPRTAAALVNTNSSPSSSSTSSLPVQPVTPYKSAKQTPRTPLSKKSPPVSPRSNKPLSPSSSGSRSGYSSPVSQSRLTRPISPLDPVRLNQRQKQIDYGYKTVGYLRYRLFVAKDQRKPEHPRTPKKSQACSKRSWDGQLKKWRRDLHLWDPTNMEAFKNLLSSELVDTIIQTSPDLAEIVRAVKEKLNNPISDEEGSSDSDYDSNEEDETEETDSNKNTEEEPEKRAPAVARILVYN